MMTATGQAAVVGICVQVEHVEKLPLLCECEQECGRLIVRNGCAVDVEFYSNRHNGKSHRHTVNLARELRRLGYQLQLTMLTIGQ